MGSNLLSSWDYISIVVYFVVVAWMGTRLAGKQESAEQYFVAKKKVPGWAMGLSLFAATLSCFTFIGFPGWTYREDMQIIVREYMSVVAFAVAGIFIIPLYRAVVKISVFEYIELRFGYLARLYGSIGVVLGHPIGQGVHLFVLAIGIHALTGLDMIPLVLVIGAITLMYTLRGGIEGTVWIEAMQGLIFIGSGLLSLGYLMFFATPGGPAEIFSVADAGGKLRIIDPTFSLVKPVLFIYIWAGFFQNLANHSGSLYTVQRYLIAPTLGSALRGKIISLSCCVVTWATFMLIGPLLWSFYQLNPGLLPVGIEADKIFPYFIGTELPAGLAGLILAGLISSGMSAVSSGLNSIGSCMVSDYYDRLFHSQNQRRRLLVSRLCVLYQGTMSIAAAVLLTYWEGGIVKFMLDVISSILGPILGGGGLAMFMLGVFTRRTTKRGLYAGLVIGLVFCFWAIGTQPANPIGKLTSPYLTFLPQYTWHPWLLFGLSNLLVFACSYLLSLILDPGTLADRQLTVYGHSLFKGRSAPVAPTDGHPNTSEDSSDGSPPKVMRPIISEGNGS